MRPVDKGSCPCDAISKYQEARGYLIDRLGGYCSYCGMHLDAMLAVEHIQPKSRQPGKELEWENLLLACVNCNSTKGDTDINDANIDDYLWPDIHNTLLALQYSEGGLVDVNSSLPPEIQEKARRLIRLVGLDKIPDVDDKERSDRRWLGRRMAWKKAQRAKQHLLKDNTAEMREQIADTASDSHFSIWMTVFADDADMKRRFIDAFPGTAKTAFDTDFNPVPRTSQGI